MKKKRAFGIELVAVMIIGILCKELTERFIPFIVNGNTQYYNTWFSWLNLANQHHVYLPNIDLQYASAWGLLVQLVTCGILYVTSYNKYYNLKIGTYVSIVSIITNTILLSETGAEGIIKDIILVAVVGIMYILGMFNNRYMHLMLGLYLGGSIGNFLEGNIRGYVVNMLWLLPQWSTQVHNIEDMCIWTGLFGMAIGIVVFLVKFLIKRASKEMVHKIENAQ